MEQRGKVRGVEANRQSEQTREKKTSKMDQSGLTQEELLQQQQELFASATSKFNQGP